MAALDSAILNATQLNLFEDNTYLFPVDNSKNVYLQTNKTLFLTTKLLKINTICLACNNIFFTFS